MAPAEWVLDTEVWHQIDPGRFVPVTIDGKVPAPAWADWSLAIGAACGEDGAFFPAAFRAHPETGAPLRHPHDDPARHWLPPFGTGSALRVVDTSHTATTGKDGAAIVQAILTRYPDSASFDAGKQDIPLPRRGGLRFLVSSLGHHRPALFAISLAGDIFVRDEVASAWLPLAPAAAPLGPCLSDMEGSSISVLPNGAMVLASEAGPACVEIDLVTLSYRVTHRPGRCEGGAGLIDRAGVVPVRVDGALEMASVSSSGQWVTTPVDGDVPAGESLGVPFHDETASRLIWIGRSGYLSLSKQPSGDAVTWTPWPQMAEARHELGPPFRSGGGLWQLLKQAGDNGSYFYRNLSSTLEDVHPVNGARLGTGATSFRFDVHLDRPWDAIDLDIHVDQRHVILPFTEFPAQRLMLQCRAERIGQTALQKFFDHAGSIRAEYGIAVAHSHARGISVDLARPWDAQWICHDGALWLYLDSVSRLFRWPA